MFVALLVLIVVLVIAIWSLGGDDDSDDVATGTSAEPSDTADTGSESAQDPSGDTGVDGVGGDQPAQLDDDTTAAQPEEGTTTSTTSTTTTTIGIPTTTFTTTLPEDVDDYGPSTLDDNSTVSTVGLDSVHFGMTVQQAQEAAGSLMVPIAPVSACYHVVPHGAPEGIVFLVHSGTIERVDINSGPITTRSGVGVGTPDETVIDLFGASIEREVRPDGTVDLIFVPRDAGDANFRVIFNVADGRVRALQVRAVALHPHPNRMRAATGHHNHRGAGARRGRNP